MVALAVFAVLGWGVFVNIASLNGAEAPRGTGWKNSRGARVDRCAAGVDRFSQALAAVGLGVMLVIAVGCAQRRSAWQLMDVTGHLPDLQFSLQSAADPQLTAEDFRGKITLVFFGYAHCPDICPMTMARLGGAVKQLGERGDAVRILFVSVDPQRDSPTLLRDYAGAFSPQAVGATGSPAAIEMLAKRYRVAYQAEPPDKDGAYEVMHSKAVYVFDGRGRARLLIDDGNPPAAIVHDLGALIDETKS